jgi:hypothetical protein
VELLLLLIGWGGTIAAGAGLGIGLTKLARSRRQAATRKRLVGTPIMLGDGREGTMVRITGTVKALEAPMHAPLSEIPCVAYKTRAEELRQALGSPFPVGQPLAYQTVKLQPFVLVRENERDVFVEGRYAELDVPCVPLSVDRARLQAFFHAHRVIATGGCGHIEERVVRDGDVVSIAGTLVTELDTDTAERGFRDDGPRKNRLVGDGPHPLVIGRP